MSDVPGNTEREGQPAAGGFIPPSSTGTPDGGQAAPPPWQPPPPASGAWTPPPQPQPPAGGSDQPGGAWGFAPGAFTSQPYAAVGQNQYGGPPAKKNNVLAIAAMVLSICGVIPFIGILPAIAGVVMGFVARHLIRRSNGAEGGEGFAIAAIVIGLVILAGYALVIGLLVGVAHHCTTSGNSTVCR